MERDQRLQPVRSGGFDHPPIMGERRWIEDAGRRLDPAPLEREAVGSVAQFRQEGEVFGVSMELLAGRS